MNILIAGASGFIGKVLVKELSQKHHITVLGRSLKKMERSFGKETPKICWESLDSLNPKDFAIIINLCGTDISSARWNASQKKSIILSRTSTNSALINWIQKQHATPRYFCASAVGIYGAHDDHDKVFDEDSEISPPPKDFLEEICFSWESSTFDSIVKPGFPVISLRFGVVLKKGHGLLKKIEPLFHLGLGQVLGSGAQSLSWIHYEDLVQAVSFLIETPSITGPINITSPCPVSQRVFAQSLAKACHRPLFLRIPSRIIQAIVGEMGDLLLLKGQHVTPKRLLAYGFQFQYSDIDTALEKEYRAPLSIQKNPGAPLWVWVVSLLSMGSLLGSLSRTSSRSWYTGLERSPVSPPDYIFGIVWPLLYIMIAIAGWLLWKSKPSSEKQSAQRLYMLQLLLNWSWSPLFFYAHALSFAFFVSLGLVISVGGLLLKTFRIKRAIGLLLVPYFLWLCFATYLSGYILVAN